jgi:hypothetical protein
VHWKLLAARLSIRKRSGPEVGAAKVEQLSSSKAQAKTRQESVACIAML